ncbi:MAG: hypothetical protein COA91_13840 [Robiginitomaculum sp.]|nr:MAG: hypothetical protein COA91_13840 [Robiginitomaculum sp.]
MANKLKAGYRFEEFEFVRSVGEGGFGITYLGWDHSLEKAVAIKEYFPEDWAQRLEDGQVVPLSDRYQADFEWGRDRFLAEAKTLAKFNHPNLVKAYRFFQANGVGYIVMEYIEGDPLENILKRDGTIKAENVRHIMEMVMDGLDAVHKMNFLHRDIKPANVIISAENKEPILIDFGAARQSLKSKSMVVTAIVTAGYGPHEQYAVESDNQGPWTDIYALCALGYKALTGNVPPEGNGRFENDTFQALKENAYGDPALCRAINQGLRVLTSERPRSAEEWFQIAESKFVDSGEEKKRSRRIKPRKIKPNRPKKKANPDSTRKLVVWAGVGAGLTIIGALAYSLFSSGVFDFMSTSSSQKIKVVAEKVQLQPKQRPETNPATPASNTTKPGTQIQDCPDCPVMIVLPAGSFDMGSAPGTKYHQSNEAPVHRVKINKQFAIGKYEVTNAQWKKCLSVSACRGFDPSAHNIDMSNDSYPIRLIPFLAAQSYVEWLSGYSGQKYRLPSEAEWEYAARAGSQTIFSWGNTNKTAMANCDNCGTGYTSPRTSEKGSYPANGFGLYDMEGNVWEWTEDCWKTNYSSSPRDGSRETGGDCNLRVLRGGGYVDPVDNIRLANRTELAISPPSTAPEIGFRVVRELN